MKYVQPQALPPLLPLCISSTSFWYVHFNMSNSTFLIYCRVYIFGRGWLAVFVRWYFIPATQRKKDLERDKEGTVKSEGLSRGLDPNKTTEKNVGGRI